MWDLRKCMFFCFFFVSRCVFMPVTEISRSNVIWGGRSMYQSRPTSFPFKRKRMFQREGFPLCNSLSFFHENRAAALHTNRCRIQKNSRKADECSARCRVLRMFWTPKASHIPQPVTCSSHGLQYYNNNTVSLAVLA